VRDIQTDHADVTADLGEQYHSTLNRSALTDL
jgi:hypothetical protein